MVHNDYVRNKDGIWVNTSVFKETGLSFSKNGYYCPDPPGSPSWFDFWTEERRRCLEGYEVSGARITGDYYFYLNYCPIKLTKTKGGSKRSRTSEKTVDFPNFWDGDYNYFWFREIARRGVYDIFNLSDEEQDRIDALDDIEKDKALLKLLEPLGLSFKVVPSLSYKGLRVEHLLGGKDMIILKSRRKGFSFKNASLAVNTFFHRPHKFTLLMAYNKSYLYPDGIFTKSMSYINHINNNTAFTAPSDYVKKADFIRNSYETIKNGVKIEAGFMSAIEARSFKDNPQAGVGKDCYDIIGEEVGTWGTPGGLRETVASMLPSLEDGDYRTGMMTLFGTSNDLEAGTVDFAYMFEHPEVYKFLPFYDIWGKEETKKEGFFFPAQLNYVGYYDENGNSDLKGATEALERDRKIKVISGATQAALGQLVREFPLNSSEALSTIAYNNFPVEELRLQLQKVKSLGLQETKGTPVELIFNSDNQIIAKPILNGKKQPITSYRDLPIDLSGCIVVYEQPSVSAPRGTYKIGYDPVSQDSGTSLGAIIVYKSVVYGEYTHSLIVAEYIGRLELADDIDLIAEKLAIYYNTTIMHENMTRSTITYFTNKRKLNLLAYQPERVISANVKLSKVARVYGCHMNDQLKDAGERYVKQWLLTELDTDENGNKILALNKIYSQRLLEELIEYNRKGNFDLVSALFMCLFQVQEEGLNNQLKEKEENSIAKQILIRLGYE